MRYEQLRILNAVIETGSFSKAAEQVFKSQAAVSKAIKTLESELDIQLFSRDSYRPELTQVGKVFHQKSLDVIAEFERLELLARELSLGVEPELNIVVSAVCEHPEILAEIKKITQKYPQTKIHFSINTLGRVLDILNKGEADIAITPYTIDKSHFEAEYLYDIPMMLVASPDLELSKIAKITKDQLKQYTQIVIKNEHPNVLDLFDYVLLEGEQWNVSGLLSKKEVILAGLGWGQLPKHLIVNELEKERLIPLIIDDVTLPSRRVHIVRRGNIKRGPVAQELWSAFTDK